MARHTVKTARPNSLSARHPIIKTKRTARRKQCDKQRVNSLSFIEIDFTGVPVASTTSLHGAIRRVRNSSYTLIDAVTWEVQIGHIDGKRLNYPPDPPFSFTFADLVIRFFAPISPFGLCCETLRRRRRLPAETAHLTTIKFRCAPGL